MKDKRIDLGNGLVEHTHYFYNGKSAHYFTIDGVSQGEVSSYYPNGQLYLKSNFLDGKLHGEFKTYYDNGQLEIHGNYFNGNREGLWHRYFNNGELIFTSNFINDKGTILDIDKITALTLMRLIPKNI